MKTLLAMFVPLVQYGPLIFIAGCFLVFFIFPFIVIVYSYETAPPDQKRRMEERWAKEEEERRYRKYLKKLRRQGDGWHRRGSRWYNSYTGEFREKRPL